MKCHNALISLSRRNLTTPCNQLELLLQLLLRDFKWQNHLKYQSITHFHQSVMSSTFRLTILLNPELHHITVNENKQQITYLEFRNVSCGRHTGNSIFRNRSWWSCDVVHVRHVTSVQKWMPKVAQCDFYSAIWQCWFHITSDLLIKNTGEKT